MLLTQQLEEMDLPHAEAGVVRTLLDRGSALRALLQQAGKLDRRQENLLNALKPFLSGWAMRDGRISSKPFWRSGNIWTVISRKSTPTALLRRGTARRSSPTKLPPSIRRASRIPWPCWTTTL